MHDELLDQEIFYTVKEAEFLIEIWRKDYNHVRPHNSLEDKPPASVTRAFQAACLTYEREEIVGTDQASKSERMSGPLND
jgi:hypothetical protein